MVRPVADRVVHPVVFTSAMPPAAPVLSVAPLAGLLALSYVTRPATATVVAPLRLAVARAAVLTGAYAVLVVEALGAAGALTTAGVAAAWLVFLVAVAAAVAWRRRRDRRVPASVGYADRLRALPARWRAAGRAPRWLLGTVAGLVLAELVVALLAEPNNFDSQTYHLPRVEHWAAQGSLDFWPTAIHRQVTIPPGAEYLLLHLRLLTGGDALHNLVQWAAMLGCLLLASRVTAQLGGGVRAQALAVFLVATTPMVTLQATSTQTDLVVAAWVACAATFALDGVGRPATVGAVLGLGAATGLVAVTKTSGLLGVAPLLLLWGLAQLKGGGPGYRFPYRKGPRLTTLARTTAASVAVLAVAAVLVGPYLGRMQREFGNPLGPPRLRESIPMQRHDPPAVLVNLLRIGHTAFDTPLLPLGAAAADGIEGLSRLVGVDPQDRLITFGGTRFPVPAWYPDEDRAALPLTGGLALVGVVLAVARPRRVAGGRPVLTRAYAAAVTGAVLLHATMIKWQPWGNRLLLYALVLAAPVGALWVEAVLRRRVRGRTPTAERAEQADTTAGRAEQGKAATGRRAVAVLATGAVLATSALAGALSVSYGFPRRLVGDGSLLTTSPWETRFVRRPAWAPEYRWAADAVRASGARRVGLLEGNDDWEYPWWLLLRSGDDGARREIVALRSVLPDRPPADPASVDAIVCTGDRAACAKLLPRGWRLEFRGYVGYALPATPPR
jgi:hypothetical protein